MKPTSATPRSLDRAAIDPSFEMVDAADFLKVHLAKLHGPERKTLEQWAGGMTAAEIARHEGVTQQAIAKRISLALGKLRSLAGVPHWATNVTVSIDPQKY